LGAEVDLRANWTDFTYISYPVSTRKIHLVFYNFPEKYKSREESLNFLKENGDSILTDLKKFNFGQ